MSAACRFGWHQWGNWTIDPKYAWVNADYPERRKVCQMRVCICCGKTQFRPCK